MKFKISIGFILLFLLFIVGCAHFKNQSNLELKLSESEEKVIQLETEITSLNTKINEYVQKQYHFDKLIDLVSEHLTSEEQLMNAKMELILMEKELNVLPDTGIINASNIIIKLEQNLDELYKKELISEEEVNQNKINYLVIKINLGLNSEDSENKLKSLLDSEIKRAEMLMKKGLISKKEYQDKKQELENYINN